MTDPEHCVRPSLVDREYRFRLTADALIWNQGAASKSVPYGQIEKMQLIRYSGGGGPGGQVTIRARGRRKLKLRSQHYLSLGRFENRSHTYAPFVSELVRRVASANLQARFVRGSLVLWFLWLAVIVLVISLFALVVAILLFDASPAMTLVSALLLALAAAPFAWRNLRATLPSRLDPDNLPDDLLRF